MRILDTLFWIFAGGVVLWIAGVWISMLIPRWPRASTGRRAASSGGGFAESGVDSMVSHGTSSDFSSDSSGGESGGGGSGGGGDFSGGGGESGGGGSSGGW